MANGMRKVADKEVDASQILDLRGTCGRLSGCHASPLSPTGLADGFGEGVT